MKKTNCFALLIFLAAILSIDISAQKVYKRSENLKVDFEYAPLWWQTAIGLPDDYLKTIVGKEGHYVI